MTEKAAEKKRAATRHGAARPRQVRITLVRSLIGYPQRQRETVRGLGLRKLHSQVVRPETPEVLGMVRKISHLVRVEAVEEP